jgi:hypothetical protein
MGVLYLELSSLRIALVLDSNAVFNSPTRPNVGRSVGAGVKPPVLSVCCCSNLDRRSSIIEDEDDERLGG